MKNLNQDFKNKTIDYKKLIDYGFKKENDNYIYTKKINDNNFEIIIEISSHSQTSKVIDLSTGEEYILAQVKNITGKFIGQIKEKYDNILNDIIDKCTTPNIFKTKQAQSIIKYIKEKYNDNLEFLWKKFPNNAIWRNKDNNKWYGLLGTIPETKLGLKSDNIIEIINLRYPKETIQNIIDNKHIFKGYHMNKNNWITIKLDNNIDIEKIYKFIDNSYKISLKK